MKEEDGGNVISENSGSNCKTCLKKVYHLSEQTSAFLNFERAIFWDHLFCVRGPRGRNAPVLYGLKNDTSCTSVLHAWAR
jgi:hypothetical protein